MGAPYQSIALFAFFFFSAGAMLPEWSRASSSMETGSDDDFSIPPGSSLSLYALSAHRILFQMFPIFLFLMLIRDNKLPLFPGGPPPRSTTIPDARTARPGR